MNGLDKLVEELGGNFLLGGAVIQFSDATFIDAFKTIYEAGSIAEREACAKVCEQRAADHEEDSRLEDDPDYKERFLVYAKHERRCAKEIRSRGSDAT